MLIPRASPMGWVVGHRRHHVPVVRQVAEGRSVDVDGAEALRTQGGGHSNIANPIRQVLLKGPYILP